MVTNTLCRVLHTSTPTSLLASGRICAAFLKKLLSLTAGMSPKCSHLISLRRVLTSIPSYNGIIESS